MNRELKILLSLGKKGALSNDIAITTKNLGKELGIPQQSVSRILIQLTNSGLIIRKKGIRGYTIRISPKGKESLKNIKNEIKEVLEEEKKLVMKGKVTSGLKDGRYYLGFDEYRKQIRAKLGFDPYKGTLNIKLNTWRDEEVKEKLQSMGGIEIQGFKKEGKIFGAIKCFKCKINGVDASIIIPTRSHYGSDVLEIIAPFNLRKKMNLKDGSDVVVEVIQNKGI